MHPFLTDIKTLVLDTLFPVECIICNTTDVLLCQNCVHSFARLTPQRCFVCQKPSPFGITHASCQTPQGINGLISLFDYKDERVAKAIIYGKYKFLPELYSTLGNELIRFLEQEKLVSYFAESIITPLPLARGRQRWRGFNQAHILGQSLHRAFDIPAVSALRRTRSTKVQKNLNYVERQKNVEACFEVNQEITIEPRTYIVIDDVITTGATLKEAAKVLKQNGATSVWCFTLAKD